MGVYPAKRGPRLRGQLCEIGGSPVDVRLVHPGYQHVAEPGLVQRLPSFYNGPGLALPRRKMAALLLLAARAPEVGVGLVHGRIAPKDDALLPEKFSCSGNVPPERAVLVRAEVVTVRRRAAPGTAGDGHKVGRGVGEALELQVRVGFQRGFRHIELVFVFGNIEGHLSVPGERAPHPRHFRVRAHDVVVGRVVPAADVVAGDVQVQALLREERLCGLLGKLIACAQAVGPPAEGGAEALKTTAVEGGGGGGVELYNAPHHLKSP